MRAPQPRIVTPEVRDMKVLYVDPSILNCDLIEAKAEQDPRLQRITVFTTSTVTEARDLAKTRGCDLAIYKDNIDGRDFVFIQMELRNAQPLIELVPIISVPTVQQLSSHRRVGGIFSFADANIFGGYEDFVSIVLSYVREQISNPKGIADAVEYAKTVQNFLLVGSEELRGIKPISSLITEALIINFDLDTRTAGLSLAAEMIYSPTIQATRYRDLLNSDKHNLSEILSKSASWEFKDSKPQSAAGFTITLANFLAKEIVAQVPSGEILFKISERPHFLFHAAIRTLDEQKLRNMISLGSKVQPPVKNVSES